MVPETFTEWIERVRVLNDLARMRLTGCRVYMTSGIAAFPPWHQRAVMARVRSFDEFTLDNDPRGEHDFGAFDYAKRRIFWKIDCYDRTGRFASPDAADPAVTKRVITVMLAEEW
jgi:hypothetical protein